MSRLFVFVAAVSALRAGAADEWSSAQLRGEWNDMLRQECSNEVVPTTLYDPIGHLVALNGYFVLSSAKAEVVRAWLVDHATIFGVQDEIITFRAIEPFFDMSPVSADEYSEVEVGVALYFSFDYEGAPGDQRGAVVFVDLRPSSPVLRGVYSSHHPELFGRLDAQPGFTLEDAEAVVDGEIGDVVVLEGKRVWSSVDWLEARVPAEKEYLWLVKALDIEGGVRDLVVSPSQGIVTWQSASRSHFSGPSQLHVGYFQNGGGILGLDQ